MIKTILISAICFSLTAETIGEAKHLTTEQQRDISDQVARVDELQVQMMQEREVLRNMFDAFKEYCGAPITQIGVGRSAHWDCPPKNGGAGK